VKGSSAVSFCAVVLARFWDAFVCVHLFREMKVAKRRPFFSRLSAFHIHLWVRGEERKPFLARIVFLVCSTGGREEAPSFSVYTHTYIRRFSLFEK
jgi:hypothetical protein